MEFVISILAAYLKKEKIEVTFPQLQCSAAEIVNQMSYKMLKRIKDVLEDTTVNDPDCYQQIENIIKCFEMYDITVNNRHWDDEDAGETENET